MSTAFAERVLRIVRAIPRGVVSTYGDVATLSGTPRAARAVGTVLRTQVHDDDGVPWHRVINAAGRISFKGDLARATTQRALLEAEGVAFERERVREWPALRWDGRDAPSFFDEPIAPGSVPDDFIE